MNRVISMIRRDFALLVGYVICAGIATGVDIGILYVLTEYLGLWYLYSAALSYLAGMVTNFTLNKKYNFRNRNEQVFRQFGIFAAVALLGLALNQVILYSLVSIGGLWYIHGKIVTVLLVLLWSFYGHKKLTFGLLK